MNSIQSLLDAVIQSPFGQFINEQNLLLLTPEILLLIAISIGLFQAISGSQQVQRATWLTAVLASVFALCSLVIIFCLNHLSPETGTFYKDAVNLPVFYDMFRSDLLSVMVRGVLLLGTLLVLMFSRQYIESRSVVPAEFYVLLLGASMGAMLISGANDLIMVFVALETLSISSFILAGYLRGDLKSAEASLKYLIFGGASTAVLLFGFSLLFGLSGGQTNFYSIGAALSQVDPNLLTNPALILMSVMILGGFAFKLSAAPFHMWTPDIYEGAPTPVTAYLSVVSKIGAVAMVIRFLSLTIAIKTGSPIAPLAFEVFFIALALLSMTLGNIVALKQHNIKRMLAYSTIAHVGYMLLGFVVLDVQSVSSVLFYLLTYLFMNLGAFAVAIAFGNITGRDDINAYAGLVRKRPFLALYMTVFLLSLAGIPITAGFFAKFFLFQSVAMEGGQYLWLVVVALLNSTISLYYYLNVVRLMVVAEPSDTVAAMSRRVDVLSFAPTAIALLICFVGTLALGVFAQPAMTLSKQAVKELGQPDRYANVHVMSRIQPPATVVPGN